MPVARPRHDTERKPNGALADTVTLNGSPGATRAGVTAIFTVGTSARPAFTRPYPARVLKPAAS